MGSLRKVKRIYQYSASTEERHIILENPNAKEVYFSRAATKAP